MSEAASEKYQLVLEKVADEKQPETALFLSGCFSLPPASTRGIAASGPIALISDLMKGQAEAILGELLPSVPDGVTMRVVREGERSRVSRLQWPRPPRIYGSSVDEFVPSGDAGPHEIKCPFCGGAIRITPDFQVALLPEKRRNTDTLFRPAPTTPAFDDRDPLFSGVKPLATATGKFASLRSLQAGDTGFWMDHARTAFDPHTQDEPTRSGTAHGRGGTSGAKKSGGKPSAGLAAFMKPGHYALVVGRTRDSQTVKMIAEIMGVSEAEARDKGLNLSLCVARDISLDEAQNLLARFRNLGAKARIVKPS